MLHPAKRMAHRAYRACFNGHPPLGVNATRVLRRARRQDLENGFQWAPTLGGECYVRELMTDLGEHTV